MFIYGSDIDFDNSTQDSEWVQFIAMAYTAANNMGAAVYNSFSPTTAQGAGLSSVVAINGIERLIPTYSTVVVTIIGQANTLIPAGVVVDGNGNYWSLPPNITIPANGQIDVTATCQILGAIQCDPGDITMLPGSVSGWQSATNASAAAPGAPVEQDGQLRQRQAISAALPAVSSIGSLEAAIAAMPGVTQSRVYENSDPAPNARGIQGKSIAVVVTGGMLADIVNMIALKKGNGVGTTGTWALTSAPDAYGISRPISVSPTQNINITAAMSIKPGPVGFTSDILTDIQNAVCAYVNGLGIGGDANGAVAIFDAAAAARLYGTSNSGTFSIVPNSFTLARDGHILTPADVAMNYNESPVCQTNSVSIRLLGN